MTFGDMAASEHQSVFEENALQHFDKLSQKIQVQPEQRLSKPLRVKDAYVFDDKGPTDHKTPSGRGLDAGGKY